MTHDVFRLTENGWNRHRSGKKESVDEVRDKRSEYCPMKYAFTYKAGSDVDEFI